jgi:hypothetical protein
LIKVSLDNTPGVVNLDSLLGQCALFDFLFWPFALQHDNTGTPSKVFRRRLSKQASKLNFISACLACGSARRFSTRALVKRVKTTTLCCRWI